MTLPPTGRGRPLRFLAALGTGWVGLRVAMVWPVDAVPGIVAVTPVARAASSGASLLPADPAGMVRPPPQTAVSDRPRGATAPRATAAERRQWRHARSAEPVAGAPRVALALLGLVRLRDPEPDPLLPGVPRSETTVGEGSLPPRLSGSFWLVARGGGGGGIAPGVVGGQLGGSQAGVRLAYLLDRRRRFALAMRATTPLGTGARELAAGVEWQPTRLPVRVVAEQRFVVAGGGKGGPALGVVGGLGPKRLGCGVTLEGYGQAGVIRRDRTERYVDGAVHLAHALLDLGAAKLDFGAGAWGGAQRGAARLDVGPTLALRVPVARTSLRLSLDWRARIAGQARPGSGLALTLGTDF